MEIRIEEVLTGRALRDRILAKYGSREALERKAKGRDARARVDLVDLRHLDEEPARLDLEWTLQEVGELDARDFGRLTPSRLRLLARLSTASRELNVTELAARVRRDKKNVSDDLRVLEALGLVRKVRRGRETFATPAGSQIRITLHGEGRAEA